MEISFAKTRELNHTQQQQQNLKKRTQLKVAIYKLF